jgi:hypothetical protein
MVAHYKIAKTQEPYSQNFFCNLQMGPGSLSALSMAGFSSLVPGTYPRAKLKLPLKWLAKRPSTSI